MFDSASHRRIFVLPHDRILKNILILILICTCFSAIASSDPPGKKWVHLPATQMWMNDAVEVPEADVYEVAASRKDVAIIRDLDQVAIVQLKPEEAKWFVGSGYRSEVNKRPYLVRAVFSQGGTGRFKVSELKGDLYVFHGSLGHHMAYNQSALVVNLPVAPKEVYVIVSMAR